MTEFTKAVVKVIRAIPKGKIASYSQVAELAGRPGASRGVVWILNSSSEEYELPWHRVLRASGEIAFRKGSTHFRLQKRMLEKEGVLVAKDGSIDIEEFGWKKKPRQKRARKSTPSMFRR
ncbi:MAG: MGMT family protein [Bdellovibrionaceae bacterium]|nr:MGMT family protein [Pseudobdellovibrionaceae bacterium]